MEKIKVEIMNKIREVLRLILTTKMSNRLIAKTMRMSPNTPNRYRHILIKKNIPWSDVDKMDDNEVTNLVRTQSYRVINRQMPDWDYIHREMQNRHVTLQMLWEEYRLSNPENTYAYSQFTYYYRVYVRKLDLSMRQSHRAGETVFVDFAGRTVPYFDKENDELKHAQIFVGVLGCSNYTFVYAVSSQSTADWIDAHNHMYQFFGGVPEVVVPDNLKAAVIKHAYDPILNRTYLEQSKHYGIAIIPARVRRPQDKSKAEIGVLLASRWILAKLRHRQFFSVIEINDAISELLRKLNERPFKRLPGCRRERFELLDKPKLRILPSYTFEYAEWTSARKVNRDYHLEISGHYYSVPYQLVGNRIEGRVTSNVVEFFHRGKRIASHLRSNTVGEHTTVTEHQPKSHQFYANQTPEKLLIWAKKCGPYAAAAVQNQFSIRPHTLLGVRSSIELQRLAKNYGDEKFERACRRAEKIGSLTVKSIRSILQSRLTELDEDETPIQINLPLHGNVRGSSYYSTGGE